MSQLEHRIKEFNQNRLPEMVQLKYKAMSRNMFRFYRGTCHLFFEDLYKKGLPASPPAWISGDLHLENFGSYKGDNRLVYFDLNDFDEAALAPALWEIIRLITSILVAFEILHIEDRRAFKMAQMFIKNYAGILARGKSYYIEPKTARGIVCTFLKSVEKRRQRELLYRRTMIYDNQLTLKIDTKKHFEIAPALKRELMNHVDQWILNSPDGPYNYRVADAAFRLAGTGSVGLKRYIFLLKSIRREEKYLLVDMKQATETSLAPYLDTKQPRWQTHAERIVNIQQRMQNIPPALLSASNFHDEPYLIQELQPAKDRINFKLIHDRYRDMYQVVDDMAMLTASSQLRSSGREGAAIADKLIAFGQDTSWQQPVLDYAIKYSRKVKTDFEKYIELYRRGVFAKT